MTTATTIMSMWHSQLKIRLKASRLLKGPELILLVAGLETYYVAGATYDSNTHSVDDRCMPGTRVKVLKEAMRLIIAREGSHVIWISGTAGTGKTSIALSLCDMLAEPSGLTEQTVLLGGTFFLSRAKSSIKQEIARYIIPTLATVLVRNLPACEAALAAELKKDPKFFVKTIKHQINNLLIIPLNSLEHFTRQVVFVIDGVDQCKDETQLRELVISLADFKCQVPVKFLITSRPDTRIRKIRVHRPSLHPRIELYTQDLALVTADIQHYIQKKFESSPAAPGWYADSDPAELAGKAGGVFATAVVTVKYILSPIDSLRQKKRVREVKDLKAKGLDALNEMYAFMLNRTMNRSSSNREKARLILTAIIASRTPQQVHTLAELLGLSSFQIREPLVDLQAVVFVPETNEVGELLVLQMTFVEFLFKFAPVDVRVSESYGHDALARGCLRRLAADDLCFNVTKTKSSYDANPESEPDIARSLRYASIAWPFHVYNASEPSKYDIQIDTVLRSKFLFWLELTSRIVEADHWSELLLRAAAAKVRLYLKIHNVTTV